MFLGENAQQFSELLDQLRQEYKPVGIAEELEVGRIAQCWWKLKRASRYENAEIYFGQVQVISQAPPPPQTVREMMMPREKSLTLLLEGAEKEIEASGKISSELQEKMLAADPSFPERWAQLQAIAQQKYDRVVALPAQEAGRSSVVVKRLISLSPDTQAEHASAVALATTKLAKKCIESQAEHRFESILNLVFDRQAIPNRDGLDKLLRYEAAIERDLGRALHRLERLQRRRKGEPVPPPVSVRLIR